MSTKRAIVEAAAEIFVDRGYEGMTMKLIADKVGITPPAVYAFFKSKEDVFLNIYEIVLSEHYDIAVQLTEKLQDESVKTQLHQVLRGLFSYHIRERLQMKIFMRLLLFPPKVFTIKLDEEMNKLAEMEIALFAKVFDKGMQNGEIKSGDSRVYGRAMLCLMDGLFWQLQRYQEEQFWEQLEVVWEHFWRGIAVQR